VKLPQRRGATAQWVALDAVSMAWRRRNIFGLLLLATIVVAAGLAFVTKVVLPWAIYPAL
jgi:hypothetical protein